MKTIHEAAAKLETANITNAKERAAEFAAVVVDEITELNSRLSRLENALAEAGVGVADA